MRGERRLIGISSMKLCGWVVAGWSHRRRTRQSLSGSGFQTEMMAYKRLPYDDGSPPSSLACSLTIVHGSTRNSGRRDGSETSETRAGKRGEMVFI